MRWRRASERLLTATVRERARGRPSSSACAERVPTEPPSLPPGSLRLPFGYVTRRALPGLTHRRRREHGGGCHRSFKEFVAPSAPEPKPSPAAPASAPATEDAAGSSVEPASKQAVPIEATVAPAEEKATVAHTLEGLLKRGRSFQFDLCPRLIFGRGPMGMRSLSAHSHSSADGLSVQLTCFLRWISQSTWSSSRWRRPFSASPQPTRCAAGAQQKLLTRSHCVQGVALRRVPVSKSDIFQDSHLRCATMLPASVRHTLRSMLEKRSLVKLLQVLAEATKLYENQIDEEQRPSSGAPLSREASTSEGLAQLEGTAWQPPLDQMRRCAQSSATDRSRNSSKRETLPRASASSLSTRLS
jgi:hypothetical protein